MASPSPTDAADRATKGTPPVSADGTAAAPMASSPGVRIRMQTQRSRDTEPELSLRRLLHATGLRYRVDRAPVPGLRRRADIVFGPGRVAVFVDGCFWHGCPAHGTRPAANADWWRQKLDRNRLRDADTDARLAAAGWLVVRVWEHEDAGEAATRVAESVRLRQGGMDKGAARPGRPTDENLVPGRRES